MKNLERGDVCEAECKPRSWSGKNANMVVGIVKSSPAEGSKPMLKVEGNYTQTLSVYNL